MSIVNLFPNQVDHARRLLNNIINMKLAFDISEPGSGKTYVSVYIASQLIKLGYCDYILFIVPHESKKIWSEFVSKLSAKSNIMVHNNMSSSRYKFTKKTFVIVDEMQDLLSNSANLTFSSIIDELEKVNGSILLVSGTPFSDFARAYTLFTSLKLVNLPLGKPRIANLKAFDFRKFVTEKANLIKKIDDGREPLTMSDCLPYDGKIVDRIAAIHQIIMKTYSSECARTLPSNLIINQVNHVYPSDYRDVELLEEFKASPGAVMDSKLCNIHYKQLPFIADASIKVLKANDNAKIIVAVLHADHANFLNLFFGKMG